jgi:hypothetical protein
MLGKFVKVFPHEYKRVLGVARQAAKAASPPPVAESVTASVEAR